MQGWNIGLKIGQANLGITLAAVKLVIDRMSYSSTFFSTQPTMIGGSIYPMQVLHEAQISAAL